MTGTSILGQRRVRTNQLHTSPLGTATPPTAAAARRSAQLPTSAPLLDELEVAGWSSHRRQLGGNFHDWLIVDGRTLLVIVGQATASPSNATMDATEAALVGQAAWATVRSHACHASDAGTLLSLAAHSLWPITNAGLQASLAVALIDLDGGHANVAMAGDCVALKIRATGCEQIAERQPALGAIADFTYLSYSLQLSLHERILLVADQPQQRPTELTTNVASSFAQLDADSHRRMMAADSLAITREFYQGDSSDANGVSTSIIAVRRR